MRGCFWAFAGVPATFWRKGLIFLLKPKAQQGPYELFKVTMLKDSGLKFPRQPWEMISSPPQPWLEGATKTLPRLYFGFSVTNIWYITRKKQNFITGLKLIQVSCNTFFKTDVVIPHQVIHDGSDEYHTWESEPLHSTTADLRWIGSLKWCILW